MQLARDVKPRLDQAGVKTLLVSIGTVDSGKEFAARTGFPADALMVDPDNAAYDALGFYRGFKPTFLSKETGVAIKERQDKDGAADLKAMLKDYKLFSPPKSVKQTLIQGGCLIFDGRRALLVHLDPSTAAHIDYERAVSVATQGL